MSTITPLIDTLMHQVLGKGGNPAPKVLNEPVRPVDPGEGPRAMRSDSRLDARADPRAGGLGRLSSELDALRTSARSDGARPLSPGSTQTHFSPAARSIAELLMRFPSSSSVLRPQAPLMSSTETSSPQVLAQRLEASVKDSGLFYESHLKRWFQGDMSRQQLQREPQMQPGVRPSPTANVAAGGARALAMSGNAGASPAMIQNPLSPEGAPPLRLPAPVPFLLPTGASSSPLASAAGGGFQPGGGAGPVLPGSILSPVPVATAGGHTATPPAAAANAAQGAATAGGNAGVDMAAGLRQTLEMPQAHQVTHQSREVVHESLQSLVRHQLDMLVAPTIRWEGDVWAGIFMALTVNLPRRDEPDDQASEQGETRDESQEGWQSDIRLEVPDLGAFDASLRLYRNTLAIDLTTSSTGVHERLEDGLPTLEQRLSALDLQQVSVRAHYREEEAGHEP